MSSGRLHVGVENLIAEHVALSFGPQPQRAHADGMAAEIRSRITDRFEHRASGLEQDNSPSAILALRDRIMKAFPPSQPAIIPSDRTEQLVRLQTALQALRDRNATPVQDRSISAPVDLLLERQQLALKNALTEGFGRLEMWLVSLAALILIMLKALDLVWALPLLAVGIGRSWYQDRRCAKRLVRISEIDALVTPAQGLHH